MFPHDRPGAEELLSADLIERGGGVLQHVEFIEHDFGAGQHLSDNVQIRPVHVGTDGFDGRPLPRIQPFAEQRSQTVLAALLLQADHLAADQIGEHGPEVLALPALDFIHGEVPGPAFRPRPVPRLEKGAFRAAGGPPAHRMPHGGVACRHRLTVQPDPLPEPARQPGVGIRKAHPLGADATLLIPEAAQRVAQRHRMLGPWDVVPGAHLRVADAPRPSPTARTDIAPQAAALDLDDEPLVILPLHPDDPIFRQTQNPRTITERSHRVLPLSVATQREHYRRRRWLVVSLLFLDVDLYEPTRTAIQHFLPRMPKGSVIASDQLDNHIWPGEVRAVLDTVGIRNLELQRFQCPYVAYAIL